MGAIAMAGMVFVYWRFVSRRSALILIAFLALGVLSYATRDDKSRQCDGRTWFCDLIPPEVHEPAAPALQEPEPCPPVEPIQGRIFQSDAAMAEVDRLIRSGVCQDVAIENVANGWKAPYDPDFLPWWRKLF